MNIFHTALSINKNTGLISKLLGGAVVVLIVIYLYNVNVIIGAMLTAKQDIVQRGEVLEKYQALEEHYLKFSELLTYEDVYKLGFVPQNDGVVVIRNNSIVARR